MAMYKELQNAAAGSVRNFRNDMYVVSEALRLMQKTGQPAFQRPDAAVLNNYKKHIDARDQVHSHLGKSGGGSGAGLGHHDRLEADCGDGGRKNRQKSPDLRARRGGGNHGDGHHRRGGLVRPPGQHHARLSSGVAGTMAANKSGLQWSTVRNLAMAWVLTLPASIILSATLFWVFRSIAK